MGNAARKKRRSGGDQSVTVSNLKSPGIETQTSRPIAMSLTNMQVTKSILLNITTLYTRHFGIKKKHYAASVNQRLAW